MSDDYRQMGKREKRLVSAWSGAVGTAVGLVAFFGAKAIPPVASSPLSDTPTGQVLLGLGAGVVGITAGCLLYWNLESRAVFAEKEPIKEEPRHG